MAKIEKTPPQDVPPLSGRSLRKDRINVAVHPTPKVDRSARIRFEMDARDMRRKPNVKVDLSRSEDGSKWLIGLDVPAGFERSITRSPIQPVFVGPERLDKFGDQSLLASVPRSLPELHVKPRPVKLQPSLKAFRIGKIEYTPTTIFNPDGRQPYYDESYPWHCLVRVTNPRGSSGSGILIGPRHVLTASHCIDWTPGWLRVEVLHHQHNYLDAAYGTLAYASTKVKGPKVSYSENDEDYAVVVLDKPLGQMYGWLGARTYRSKWDNKVSSWVNLGYPGDIGHNRVPTWQTNFYLDELGADFGSARLLRSKTFDNYKGQSGGPVFGVWPEGPYVVGVVSGENKNYNLISGGSLLTSLVRQARSEHP